MVRTKKLNMNIKKMFNKKSNLILSFLLLMCLLIGFNIYKCQTYSEITQHNIDSSKIDNKLVVLHLSDLHNRTFGDYNSELIDMSRDASPDIILLTGDLINMDEEDTTVAEMLISDLIDIAPVYVSMGNHEVAYEENFGISLTEVFEDAGAVVLDREYVDIEVNNQKLRIGGIYGYCLPAKFFETGEADPEECAFLSDFQDTERYTILMCHMPVCWMINEGLDEWDVDCVFAGHAHGGQIILPFIGGVYAPDMGLFPGRLEGVYSSKDKEKHLVLSRGLGSEGIVPRINNRPEIVVTKIQPIN